MSKVQVFVKGLERRGKTLPVFNKKTNEIHIFADKCFIYEENNYQLPIYHYFNRL